MLENNVKILKAKATPKKVDIKIESAVFDNGIITITAQNHNILSGEYLYFYKELCGNSSFYDRFYVYDVLDSNTFRIRYDIRDYILKPNNGMLINDYLIPMQDSKNYIQFELNNGNEHIFSSNHECQDVRSNYDFDYTFGEPVQECQQEYLSMYNGSTLYKTKWIDSDGNRVINTEMLNSHDCYVWVSQNGVKKLIGTGFVPALMDGSDNRRLLLINGSIDNDLTSSETSYIFDGVFNFDIYNNITNLHDYSYICNDCRFFNVGNILDLYNGINISLNDNVETYFFSYTVNLNIGLSEDSAYNLTHEENIKEYLTEEKYGMVNNIVDFERQMFTPVTVSDSSITDFNGETIIDDVTLTDLKKIRFNLFLREREYDEETGDWHTDDAKYWESLTCNNGVVTFKSDKIFNKDKGDLLGSMGFEDNDVYNQNKRLNKTFIRVSFYDTTNRGNQKMLFYSTIFINTPKQYAKYMLNVSSKIKMDDYGYVNTVNANDDLALCTNFECFDKFNMSGSSEGFYLYIFPDIVEGAKLKTIYMKVEFNNAKYGKIIPLIHPVDEDNNEVLPPEHYQKTVHLENGDEIRYTDLKQLYSDMYIPVHLKYDYNKNRYVWIIPQNETNDEVVFNLYEPRIIDKK